MALRPNEEHGLQAVVDAVRASGWEYGTALALTVAQMLAVAASRLPAMAEVRGAVFDPESELTKQAWARILDRFLALDPRMQPDHVRIDRADDESPSGLLDWIRRSLLDFQILRPGQPASPALLQAVLDLVDQRHGERPIMSRETQFFLAEALRVDAGERVYCAEFGAVGVALLLAAERRARVLLEVENAEAARLCVWLAAAAVAEIDVWARSPQLHSVFSVSGNEEFRPRRDDFDAAVLHPPFGWHGPRALLESRLERAGLPSGSSPDSLHVMEAARRARRAACFVPAGYLFRTTKAEQILKETAIVQHGLDAIVALPRAALGGYGTVSVSVLLFRSSQRAWGNESVLMVDARSAGERSDAWHAEVLETLLRREDSQTSALVSLRDMAAQDFNLTVERYVLSPEARHARDALAAAEARLEDLTELHKPQSLSAPRAGRRAGRQLLGPSFLALDELEHAVEDGISFLMEGGERLLEVGVFDIDEAGIVRQPRKEVPPTPEAVQRSRKARLEAGDVLIVNKGSVGKVGFVREIPPGQVWLASQSFVVARLRRGGPVSDPHVLFRFLSSDVGQASLRSVAVGTTIPGLQMADVRRLPVLVPSKKTQTWVAEEMRRFFDTQDRIVALRDESVARLRTVWPERPAANQTEPHLGEQ